MKTFIFLGYCIRKALYFLFLPFASIGKLIYDFFDTAPKLYDPEYMRKINSDPIKYINLVKEKRMQHWKRSHNKGRRIKRSREFN